MCARTLEIGRTPLKKSLCIKGRALTLGNRMNNRLESISDKN